MWTFWYAKTTLSEFLPARAHARLRSVQEIQSSTCGRRRVSIVIPNGYQQKYLFSASLDQC